MMAFGVLLVSFTVLILGLSILPEVIQDSMSK
jgi:hypothetical protein